MLDLQMFKSRNCIEATIAWYHPSPIKQNPLFLAKQLSSTAKILRSADFSFFFNSTFFSQLTTVGVRGETATSMDFPVNIPDNHNYCSQLTDKEALPYHESKKSCITK